VEKPGGGQGVASGGGEHEAGGLGGLLEHIANRLKCRGQSRARTKSNLNDFAPLRG
jgi:hypothetical protein